MKVVSILGFLLNFPFILLFIGQPTLDTTSKIQGQEVLRDTLLILELNKKAEELRYKKSDSIKFLAREALDLSKELDYEKGIIYSYYNLALYELYQGNVSKSMEYYNKNTTNPNLKKYPDLAIKLYNDIAQAYFIRAEHPKAFEAFLKAADIAEATGNASEIIRVNSNLGTLFLLLEDYGEARTYYEKSFSLFDENTPTHIKGITLANMGYLDMKINKLDEALKHLKAGLEYTKGTTYSTIIAFNYLTLGDVYILNKEYSQALEFYENARHEYLKNGDKKGNADLLYGMAVAYKGLQDYKKSKELVKHSLELYTSFNLQSGLEKCNRLLYEISKIENDITSSLSYLERAEAYSDSISKDKNKTSILMLKTKLEHEKEKQRLEQISTSTISKQRNYLMGAGGFLAMSILTIFIIYRSNKKRKQLNLILEEKTKILTENQKILNETNKTKDKLFSIIGHDLRSPIVSLKGLLKMTLEENDGEAHFKKFVPKLQTDLDHIQFTLDNLLKWGQTQMQGAVINPVKIKVKEEILDIIGLFNENLTNKEISLIESLEEEMCVITDLNHFRIIFRNLISNAIKFTDRKGTIKIFAELNSEILTISVMDDGVGMTENNIKKIWHHKEHFTTYGTDKEKGTGLGLTLCREMVEKNNGSISLVSKTNQGTTFHVNLPICNIKV